MVKIVSMKLPVDHEYSDYYRRLGNKALSHEGRCANGWREAPKNVFNGKIKEVY
jgi:hypothetical protein